MHQGRAESDRFTVEGSQGYTGTNEVGTDYKTVPAEIRVGLSQIEQVMSPAQARDFVRDLAVAISEAASTGERTVR